MLAYLLLGGLILAVIASVLLPLRRVILLGIALTPWVGIEVDVGVSLTASQCVFMVAMARAALSRSLGSSVPKADLAVGALTVASALVGLVVVTTSATPEFAGGPLRNGWPRVLVSIVSFVVALGPLLLTKVAQRHRLGTEMLHWFLRSVLLLCAVGWVQMVVWYATGEDPLPVGFMQGELHGAEVRSGVYTLEGEKHYRMSSLGGEPKGFGVSAVLALLVMHVFRDRLRLSARALLLYSAFILSCIWMSASTSAWILLVTTLPLFLAMQRLRVPFSAPALGTCIFLASIGLLYAYVSNVQSGYVDGGRSEHSNTFRGIMQSRLLDRLEVEDHDWVITNTLIHEREFLPLGAGAGIVHTLSQPYYPAEWRMPFDTIIAPKSGIVFFVAKAGILGLVLTSWWLAQLAAATLRRVTQHTRNASRSPTARRVFALIAVLVLAMMLRTYSFSVVFCILAAMLSLANDDRTNQPPHERRLLATVSQPPPRAAFQ